MDNFPRLLKYLEPYRRRVGLAVTLMLLVTASTLPMPQITKFVIDEAIPRKDWNALNWVFWLVIAVYAVRGVSSFVLNYLIVWLGQRVVFDLRFQS